MEGTQYMDKGNGDEYRAAHEAVFGKSKLDIKLEQEKEENDSKEEDSKEG